MLDHKAKLAVLCDAAMFVLPSYSENFGIAIIEAMACGCPVVATNVGGVSEILNTNEGPCGYLVPPADPVALARGIAALWFSKDEQAAFRKRARRRVVESFSAQGQWVNYETLYETALQATGHHGIIDSSRQPEA